MTIIKDQFKIIYGILLKEYTRFKKYFPDEEPHWKISCVKRLQPRTLDNELKSNWKTVITGGEAKLENENKVDLIKSTKKVKEKKITQRKKTTRLSDGKILKDVPTTKSESYSEVIEEVKVVETYDSNDYDLWVETNVHLDAPSNVDIITVNKYTKTLTEETLMIWSDMVKNNATIIEGLLPNKSDPLVMMRELTKTQDLIQSLKLNVDTLTSENLELKKKVDETKSFDVKKLQNIKKSWTLEEIVNKYADIQSKLSVVKSKLLPILMKFKDLKIEEKIASNGFVMSLIDAVLYMESQMEYNDGDYSDEYD